MTDIPGATPRKIAFFLHDLRHGGAERISISLANGMASRGIPVDIVLVNKKGADAYFESIDPAIGVHSLTQGRTLTSAIGYRRYIDRARPSAVIAAMTHINVSSILARMMARHKPRLVVVEHNQMSINIKRKRGFVRLAYEAVPRAYRYADVVGAVSFGVRADLAGLTGLPSERIDVLYNPVVTPLLKRQSQLDPNDPWLRPGEPPVILAVGRLAPQKNFTMLIESFKIVRARMPARLMILGQGPAEADLRACAAASGHEGDIRLCGFVANPFSYMSHARVLALSSNWEGLPTVLIEAMACGTPVVATDCPSGPFEILDGGRLAPLVKPGDTEGFARALLATLEDPPAPQPLIARSEAFSLDAAVNRYLEVAGLA